MPIVERMLKNEPRPAPRLEIDPSVRDFYAFTKNSFALPGYTWSELDVKIPIAV